MKLGIYRIIFFVITMLSLTQAFPQRTGNEKELTQKETLNSADIALQEGKFEKALLLYNKVLKENEKNPLLNFLVGYCYLNTDFGLEQSITYLENAVKFRANKPEEEAPVETYYFLGKAYHANNQFKEAQEALNTLKTKISKNEVELLARTEKLMKYADDGLMLGQTESMVKIENAIDLNSKYSDRNPLMSNDGNSIIFTSRRENPILRKKFDDGQFDENIYISEKTEEGWSLPYGISNSINTTEHESACWLSGDGKQMIISRFDKNGGSLYLSKKNEKDEWNVPEKLNSPVNNGSASTFGSFSSDGKYIYFTSNRKGGYGGTDIYVAAYLGDNKWGPAKNLGPAINTELNEESPIIYDNGILFFSSEGHLSLGGFDIFLSLPDQTGNWLKPINLGIPINSTANDFFYKLSGNGQTAFLSSDRKSTKGKSDIYIINYSDSLMNTTGIVAGKIQCPTGFDALNNVQIIISNEKKNSKTIRIKPNKSGEYSFILPSDETYLVKYMYQDNPFYQSALNLSKSYTVSGIDQIIMIKDILLEPGNLALNNTADHYESLLKSSEISRSAYSKILNEISSGNSDYFSDKDNDLGEEDSVYSIRIAISQSVLSPGSFEGLEDVKQMKDKSGNYIYYIGEYSYEWEAQVKLKLIEQTFPEAVIFLKKR